LDFAKRLLAEEERPADIHARDVERDTWVRDSDVSHWPGVRTVVGYSSRACVDDSKLGASIVIHDRDVSKFPTNQRFNRDDAARSWQGEF
jgi:hypothetical protein